MSSSCENASARGKPTSWTGRIAFDKNKDVRFHAVKARFLKRAPYTMQTDVPPLVNKARFPVKMAGKAAERTARPRYVSFFLRMKFPEAFRLTSFFYLFYHK
ncbi:MAG: hypothetical protein U0I48_09625 [Acutalibacteraceae bacterium]|nr:hypothetical protein [Acutalibacteraceae bacterium]